jgi:hypothetical protein
VFLQHCLIGLFETKRAYLQLMKPKLQEVFLSKNNTILTGNNVLDAPASNTDGFLWRDTCVSSSHLSRTNWNKGSLSPT